jgi:hypothetical protein
VVPDQRHPIGWAPRDRSRTWSKHLAVKAGGEYWAAMAQIMPVIAFAVVFEIREISKGWTEDTPLWGKRVQSTTWAIVLLALAFGTTTALRALRGSEVASWWPQVCEWAISGSFGVLVLSPAFEVLVRSNAEFMARAFTWHPFTRGHVWWLMRQTGWRIGRAVHQMEARQFDLYLSSARLGELEKRFVQASKYLSRPARPSFDEQGEYEVRKHIASLSEIGQDLASSRARHWDCICKLNEERAEFEAKKTATLERQAEYRRTLRERTAAERAELTSTFQQFTTWAQPSARDGYVIRRVDEVATKYKRDPPKRPARA